MTTSINISSCFENPQSALASAFYRRNVDALKFALETLKADPNLIDTRNGMTIFENVLQTPNTAEFINLCINYGADMYSRNNDGRYPLHYAVDSLSPQNLRAFLSHYDNTKINVKFGHRNSLHLILEVIAKVDYESAAEIIKILVQYGCDVNMPNEKSRTPFNLLLRAQPKLKNKNDLVDYILTHTKVDLNTYRAKETTDLFQKNNPHHALPEYIETIINYDYMTSLLRQGNQSEFCSKFRVFKENEINQQKMQENEENKSNYFAECCSNLLYTAVQNNLEDVVDYLVDEGTDVNKKPDNFVHSTAHLACSYGNYRILQALFRAEPKPEVVSDKGKNLLHIATQHFGMDPSKNPSFSYEKCFYLALAYCDVNQQDEIGFSPLHYAARYRHDKAVIELLRKGSYIGVKAFNGETPIDNMSHDALETYLNECITTNTRRHGDEEQEIVIDYNFLKMPKKKFDQDFGEEIAPLHNITQHAELRPLVRHPVLSSFLFLKWSKLSLMFHSNLIMFSIFMASLICYIVLSQSLTSSEQNGSIFYSIVKGISFISIILLALREIFQFVLSRTIYLRSAINYFEIALIILGIFLLFTHHDEDDMNHTHLRILRAVTILFAAYEFLQLVGTLPYLSISTHMVILKKVALTFFKSLLLYSILLLSFALSFYSLFGGRSDSKDDDKNGNSTKTDEKEEKNQEDAFNSFSYPGIAIIKTFVMLTGEFDASALNLDRSPTYSIIFLLFVFLITIVLFNLLNALAIDDTQQIRVEGELVDLCERISLLNKYEKSIIKCSGWRWLKKYISVFPYTIPRGKIVIHPDKSNEILTYKNNVSTKDISINMSDDQELQTLNNNKTLKKFITNQRLSETLEKYYKAVDPKIMKRIRLVLEEKRQKAEEDKESLAHRMNSIESEIKMLKLTIQNLCELIESKI